MPPTTILETEQITIWYHPEEKVVHHQMHEYTHGQDFRDALMAELEVMKKYGARRLLSDDRGNTVMTPEDREWSLEVWQPKVIAAGWKHWAIVQPEHALAKLRMEKFAETYTKLGINVKIFSDPEAAMKWLVSQ